MKSTMQREDEVGKRDGGKNNDFPYKVKKIRLRGNNQQARSDNTKKRTKKAKKRTNSFFTLKVSRRFCILQF